MKNFYETPTQILFYDIDGDHYRAGIAYGDIIICACCGGTSSIEEILEDAANEGLQGIYEYEDWQDLQDEIFGGVYPKGFPIKYED